MYVKDFVLHFPYSSEKEKIIKSMEEADYTFVGKEVNVPVEWKWIRREFELQTRCISAMFSRLFGKYKTEGCREIVVECVDIIQNDSVKNFSGQYVIQVKFNFLDFISLSDYDKKCYSLRLLREGIEKVAGLKGWTFTVFESVFTKIIEENYVNEWTWNKPVKSPNKQYIAEVICQHEVRSMSIFFVIKNINGEMLNKCFLFTEQPHEFAYAQHLGKIVWLTEEVVALVNKQDDKKWELDIRELSN